jgi:hypothetical protein
MAASRRFCFIYWRMEARILFDVDPTAFRR